MSLGSCLVGQPAASIGHVYGIKGVTGPALFQTSDVNLTELIVVAQERDVRG